MSALLHHGDQVQVSDCIPSKMFAVHTRNQDCSIPFTIQMWVVFLSALQGGVGVRGACNLNIGDDLSGVLSSAPTIDALCTHGLRLKAADENRIAEGISPLNDLENTAYLTYRGNLHLLHAVAPRSNVSKHQPRCLYC